MHEEKITIQDASEVDPNMLRMLDRGLEDIEAGRTLSHEAAMDEVRQIRAARREAMSSQPSVNEQRVKNSEIKMRDVAMELTGLWKDHENELTVEETVLNMRKGRFFDT